MKTKLLEKYGGEEYLTPDKSIIEQPVDEYVEYTPLGEVAKTVTTLSKKSQYAEDVFVNGHTTVWGSFYHAHFGWGYKCCLSFERSETCNGIEGRKTNLRIIEGYENKKKEEMAIKAKMLEEKNRGLNMRDEREKKEGAFTQMFDRMNAYEQGGARAFRDHTFLNRKREAESLVSNNTNNSTNTNNITNTNNNISSSDDANSKKLMNYHFDDVK
jgi:hypothetical protein